MCSNIVTYTEKTQFEMIKFRNITPSHLRNILFYAIFFACSRDLYFMLLLYYLLLFCSIYIIILFSVILSRVLIFYFFILYFTMLYDITFFILHYAMVENFNAKNCHYQKYVVLHHDIQIKIDVFFPSTEKSKILHIVCMIFQRLGSTAATHTLGLYCMTNTDCPGELTFDDKTKRISVEWNADKHKKYYHTVEKALKEAVHTLGGHSAINPKWSNQFSNGGVFKQPIGGCCMGNTGLNGVVNDRGQVFIGMACFSLSNFSTSICY